MSGHIIVVEADEVTLVDNLRVASQAPIRVPVVDEHDVVGQAPTIGASVQIVDDVLFNKEVPVLQTGGRAQEEGEGGEEMGECHGMADPSETSGVSSPPRISPSTTSFGIP
jgi:hypothetical protein